MVIEDRLFLAVRAGCGARQGWALPSAHTGTEHPEAVARRVVGDATGRDVKLGFLLGAYMGADRAGYAGGIEIPTLCLYYLAYASGPAPVVDLDLLAGSRVEWFPLKDPPELLEHHQLDVVADAAQLVAARGRGSTAP